MKIKKLELDNFMIFNHLDVEFSPDINIISGENSTGKTALIKILYSCMKGYSNACWSKNDVTKDRIEDMLVNKIQGVLCTCGNCNKCSFQSCHYGAEIFCRSGK